jgi:NADPH:quinone reductase-like Zn-dependent oxidoreductase
VVLPPDLDVQLASMLCVNPVTAAGLLVGLAAGDWVVHNAAASAVGRLVTRLAKRRGVHTVALVRRAEQADELRALGADVVLVDGDDLAARVRAAVGGASVRRALDAVAGDATARLFGCVDDGGEVLCYGLLASDTIVLRAAKLVFSDVVVLGYSRLRSLRRLAPARKQAIFAELIALLAQGALESEIAATYALVDVKAALAHVARADRRGKVLLLSD